MKKVEHNAVCNHESCCCSGKIENKSIESEIEYSPPPGVGFSFACGHLPLSHQAGGFQMLMNSGSSKHFIDPMLIHGVESKMMNYTKKKLRWKLRRRVTTRSLVQRRVFYWF